MNNLENLGFIVMMISGLLFILKKMYILFAIENGADSDEFNSVGISGMIFTMSFVSIFVIGMIQGSIIH